MFYPKLAFTNLKKNGKTYIPYLMTCILTVMMFYVMSAIGENPGLRELPGATQLKIVLSWSVLLTGLFSAIFLFYTNSFLVKQRKKEFGLFQVLGMDKKNLTKMMTWETIFTCIIGLTAGLLLGLLFGKLMFLLLLKIMHFDVALRYTIMWAPLKNTIILFLLIFLATLIFNLLQVRTANPIELLQGGKQGEKEPKTKWVMTVIGLVTMGIGYYIAQTTESPLTAITKFFVAVILVVIGTYALFTAGSIALLKHLKKKKGFYYQTKHFVSISGMIYRMKQNAVGLANICIMSTVVLVLISITVSLYTGMEDILKTRFPMEFSAYTYNIEAENLLKVNQVIEEEMEKADVKMTDKVAYRFGTFSTIFDKKEGQVSLEGSVSAAGEEFYAMEMIPLADYNEMEGKQETLEKDQIFLYMPDEVFGADTMELEDVTYRVKESLTSLKAEQTDTSTVIKTIYVVIDDADVITQMLNQYEIEGNNRLKYTEQFNLDGEEQAKNQVMESIKIRLTGEAQECQVEYRAAFGQEFYYLYGGFLFLGIFVGTLFLMATVLIIYYKQISEGYDDRNRYQIMQKVGMDRLEVKKSIRSQVLLVFFIPLGVAVIHVSVAFKVVTKLLAVLNLQNVPLFRGCTIGTVLIFGVFYAVVFLVTSREYYKIVQ